MQIPRILGSNLNTAGKLTSLLPHKENLAAKIDEVKPVVKFQMKETLCLPVGVGPVRMTDDKLMYNICIVVTFLVFSLTKNWQNIWVLYNKSTTGKPQSPY